jgi:hypothetical protein
MESQRLVTTYGITENFYNIDVLLVSETHFPTIQPIIRTTQPELLEVALL